MCVCVRCGEKTNEEPTDKAFLGVGLYLKQDFAKWIYKLLYNGQRPVGARHRVVALAASFWVLLLDFNVIRKFKNKSTFT